VIETKRGVEELWESDRDKERCRGVIALEITTITREQVQGDRLLWKLLARSNGLKLKEQGKSSTKPKKEQKAYREYKLSGMRNVLGIRQV